MALAARLLYAVGDRGTLTSWGRLVRRALAVAAERGRHPGGKLPLALRAAPAPVAESEQTSDLVDTLTTPVRSGFVLTRRSWLLPRTTQVVAAARLASDR